MEKGNHWLFILHQLLPWKKYEKDNGMPPGNRRWCFHQADYQQSLSNLTGLVQQCGLDTLQEVINYGNPEDKVNDRKLLTYKNAGIYRGFQ